MGRQKTFRRQTKTQSKKKRKTLTNKLGLLETNRFCMLPQERS